MVAHFGLSSEANVNASANASCTMLLEMQWKKTEWHCVVCIVYNVNALYMGMFVFVYLILFIFVWGSCAVVTISLSGFRFVSSFLMYTFRHVSFILQALIQQMYNYSTDACSKRSTHTINSLRRIHEQLWYRQYVHCWMVYKLWRVIDGESASDRLSTRSLKDMGSLHT